MVQAHANSVAPGAGVVGSQSVIEHIVVLQVGGLGAFFLNVFVGLVVKVIASQFHLAVKQSPCTVDSSHPGGCDTVVVPVAATAAAETAPAGAAHSAAAHAAHHRTGQVVEATVVGIVAVSNQRKLRLVGKLTYESRGLETPVAFHVGRRDVVAASGHNVADGALHHAGLDAQVDDLLFFTVVDAGKFGLLRFLLDNLELVDDLGGNVLGGQLGIVQEEGLAVDGYLGDSLAVVGYGTVFAHFNAGKLLEKVFQHVAVGRLERRGIVLDCIFLDDDGVTHRRHRRRVELLLVEFHLDLSHVAHIGNLDLLLEWLITQQLSLESVVAGTYAGNLNLAVGLAEDIFCGLGGTFFGQRNGGESYRFAAGFVGEYRSQAVLGIQAGAEEQGSNKAQYSVQQFHNLRLDAKGSLKFNHFTLSGLAAINFSQEPPEPLPTNGLVIW